jgi:ATP phosphoribosyltransferase regulatory subunit
MINITEITPEDSIKLQKMIESATQLIKAAKYQWIQTPTIDSYNSLSPGLGNHLKTSVVRFMDRGNDSLILRPDNTAPIARIMASTPAPKQPVKLFYNASKFQRLPKSNDIVETLEFGFEIIADSSATADAEILITLSQLLTTLGFKDHIIDVGHSKLAQALPHNKREALLNNDFVKYGEVPERGSIALMKDMDTLKDLYNALQHQPESDHIYFNSGLVKELDYYTGIIFEVYIPHCGYPIASGGRYDGLLRTYGTDLPAVGAALNMNTILSVLGTK